MIRAILILLFCVTNVQSAIIVKQDEYKNKWIMLDTLSYEEVEEILDYHEALRLARTVEEYDKGIDKQGKVFRIIKIVFYFTTAAACFDRKDTMGFFGGCASIGLMSYEF